MFRKGLDSEYRDMSFRKGLDSEYRDMSFRKSLTWTFHITGWDFTLKRSAAWQHSAPAYHSIISLSINVHSKPYFQSQHHCPCLEELSKRRRVWSGMDVVTNTQNFYFPDSRTFIFWTWICSAWLYRMISTSFITLNPILCSHFYGEAISHCASCIVLKERKTCT